MSSTPTRSVRAELHTHSTCSDGAFAPSEVAARCAATGARLWSLTDHDTVEGCAAGAAAAEEEGMTFVPGIEISAYAGRSIHVLGYGYDPDDEGLAGFSRRMLVSRRDRMRQMAERLGELGFPIEIETVFDRASGAVARPHLAAALVEAGHVSSKQEAFDRFIANDGPAYVAITWPSVSDAIELIHSAGGIAVLAHPGLYSRDQQIADWVDAGLDGIECRHPRHTDGDEARYVAIANELGVLKTASSDYHGPGHAGAEKFGSVEMPGHWFGPFADRLGLDLNEIFGE